jgi:hypothetical protein
VRLRNDASASIADRNRERQHAGLPAKPYRRTTDDLPSVGSDFDGAPEVIAKVQIDAAFMRSGADVNDALRPIELGPGFEEIERRPDRRGARGPAGRLVVLMPQPVPEPSASNGPGLAVTIDLDIGKCGAAGGVEQLRADGKVCEHFGRRYAGVSVAGG